MRQARQRVVVVGASPKPHRYSHRAVRLLTEHGHEVVPMNPAGRPVAGIAAVRDLGEITGPVDTVTLYVSAKISSAMDAALARLRPRRVLFNPGAENPALRETLEDQGIHTEEACTLVLLNTNQF